MESFSNEEENELIFKIKSLIDVALNKKINLEKVKSYIDFKETKRKKTKKKKRFVRPAIYISESSDTNND
tara:strand:+ start:104 stop:313 length:210 start_codon:yes stop_codon:yes gene_type:complete